MNLRSNGKRSRCGTQRCRSRIHEHLRGGARRPEQRNDRVGARRNTLSVAEAQPARPQPTSPVHEQTHAPWRALMNHGPRRPSAHTPSPAFLFPPTRLFQLPRLASPRLPAFFNGLHLPADPPFSPAPASYPDSLPLPRATRSCSHGTIGAKRARALAVVASAIGLRPRQYPDSGQDRPRDALRGGRAAGRKTHHARRARGGQRPDRPGPPSPRRPGRRPRLQWGERGSCRRSPAARAGRGAPARRPRSSRRRRPTAARARGRPGACVRASVCVRIISARVTPSLSPRSLSRAPFHALSFLRSLPPRSLSPCPALPFPALPFPALSFPALPFSYIEHGGGAEGVVEERAGHRADVDTLGRGAHELGDARPQRAQEVQRLGVGDADSRVDSSTGQRDHRRPRLRDGLVARGQLDRRQLRAVVDEPIHLGEHRHALAHIHWRDHPPHALTSVMRRTWGARVRMWDRPRSYGWSGLAQRRQRRARGRRR